VVGSTIGSKGEVPGERKIMIRDDDTDDSDSTSLVDNFYVTGYIHNFWVISNI
jgi:hypothetical protein